MHFIVLCLGVISYAYLGECAVTAWTSPSESAADATPAAAILTKAEGYTGDFYTFAATGTAPIKYTIFSQVPDTGIFEIATDSTGVLTLASSKVLNYETSVSHKLVVHATDAEPSTGTVTVTILVTNVAPTFAATTQTTNVAEATAASTTVTTLTATDAGATLTYAISTGNTGTDFAIASGGVVTTLNALASARTASYSLVLTAADNGATPATGTTTLVVCVGCSGAVGLAAGVLSLITLAVAMLK